MLDVLDRDGLTMVQACHLTRLPLTTLTTDLIQVLAPVSIIDHIDLQGSIRRVNLLVETVTKSCTEQTGCQKDCLV